MSFIYKNFATVLNKYDYSFNEGDIIAGTIFSQETRGYLVDIGNKTAGYLPQEEISLIDTSSQDLTIHDTREFFILAQNTTCQQLVLSIKRLTYIRAWARIKQIKYEDITIEAYIKSINKGGVLVDIESIQGFIPNSHLPYHTNKKHLLHKNVSCKLLLANEQDNKLICSMRCAIVAQISKTIKVGAIIDAKVIELTHFGIFFNIYNIPALLHKSEIHNEHLENPEDIFTKGTSWPVQIIHLDIKQGRISVSLSKESHVILHQLM
uniref:Ribosomal protein S1 n=1 Tax=Hommersandiophycus borowitzkae TaxID=268573 RepID=A0A1G4NUP4_9FLOR|nr:Ribosomal protein S1 [Hommersandiophycus borowitzkae]SCW22256.1 Ribosomal protein S1 [Hommersandiophycus borowitzkae]